MHAADIAFTGVEVDADAAIGDPENGLPLIERVVDDARIALCAAAGGAMDESFKTTIEYLKTRTQFGVAIGTFQTLQHRAADISSPPSRPPRVDVRDRGLRFRRRQGTRHRGRGGQGADRQSLKFVGLQSIQLHDGIGTTMEARGSAITSSG